MTTEETTQDSIIDEKILKKSITITFTIKKLVIICTAVISFISSTAGPFVYKYYQKNIDKVKQTEEKKYEAQLKEAKEKTAEADKIKLEFNTVVNQLQTSLDFLKIHTAYNTTYILYSESASETNTKNYQNIVYKYAQFLKNKKTYSTTIDNTSFYLSDEFVYIDGIKYIIPYDVIQLVKDLKNNAN